MELNEHLTKMAKDALQVQDACNPHGVSKAFSEMLWGLHKLDEVKRADILAHPIAVLWIDKIHDMFPRPNLAEYGKAYDWARGAVKEGGAQ